MPGPWTQQGSLIGIGTASVDLAFPQGGGNYSSLALSASAAQVNVPVLASQSSGAAETWHNLGSPAAGWTAVGVARYKLLADSGLVLVQIRNLTPPSTRPADGSVVWTAANGLGNAAYTPSGPMRLPCSAGSTVGTEIPALEFENDGSIQVYGIGGTTVSRLDGTFILSTL